MEQSIPHSVIHKDIPIGSVLPEGTKRSEAEAKERDIRIIELALAEHALGLYVFAPINDGSGRPGGASYSQKVEKKKEPPVEIPPAPVPPPVPPLHTELPPALPIEPEKPKQASLPDEMLINVAAEVQQIGKRDEKTGIEEKKEVQVAEAAGTLGGWREMTEEQEVWKKRGWRKFPARLWKYTLNMTGTYGKDKSYAMKEFNKLGLQVLYNNYDFRRKLTTLARWRLREQERARKGIKWADRNFRAEVFFTETDLDKERLNIIQELTDATFQTGPIDPEKVRKLSSLLTDFKSLVKADYAAAAAQAGRVATELGPEVIHGLAGEVKGVKRLKMTGEAQQYLIDNIIKPILDNGLKRGDGNVDDEILFKAIRAANEFQSTPEFIRWHKEQMASTDKEIQDSARALHRSLSYGNDVVNYTIQTLLKHGVEAKRQVDGVINVDQWIDAIKAKSFEVAVGTVEAGPKEYVKEGFWQKAAGREIRQEKIDEIFDKIAQSGYKPFSDRCEAAAVNRNLLFNAVRTDVSTVVGGVLAGYSIYALQRVAGWGSNIFFPVVGGSAAAGLIKGSQERSAFTREYEQHNIEDALGYKTEKGMARRKQMDTLMRNKRMMQTELTDRMTKRMEAIRDDKNKEQVDTLLKELMGLLADTRARFEIMDQRGIGLLSSNNPQSYQIEKANLDLTNVEAAKLLTDHFTANPGKLRELNTSIGMDEGKTFADVMAELIKTQRTVIEKGVGANVQYQQALGLVTVDQANSIKARESAFNKARKWRTFMALGGTTAAGSFFGLGSHWLSEQLGWGQAVKEAFDPNKLHELQGVKMRLPSGFQVVGDRIVDAAHNNAVILDLAGRNLTNDNGTLVVTNALGSKIPLTEVMRGTGLVSEGSGADLAGESFTSGGGVETEMMGSGETKVPVGTHWKDIGGGNFDLISDDPSNNIIILHNVKNIGNGQLGWNPNDPINARFIDEGGDTNVFPIPGKDAVQEIDLTKKIPDTAWLNKLAGLKQGQELKDPFGKYEFDYTQTDKLGRKGLQFFEIVGGKKVEVGHNLVWFDAAKKTFSFEAMQGNAIPEKIVKALEETGLVQREDLYEAIRLDAADQVARVPANLDQIYRDNNVADFSENVRWLSHGGWAKPAGAVYGFESGENTYLEPIKDWQPFPMVEVVDGKPVFSLAHFLNAFEDAKVIDESHVQILSGPNAGKIMEINSEMGHKAEGATWLKEAARVGERVVFDSNPKNRIVMEAPEGFLNDLKAVKEGHGDLSRFFVEERFDPLSNKGVIVQFKGDSIWNAFADPRESSNSFGDNAFLDASGNVRGWTHFMWTEKPGDYSTVYSFANTGPTEHFNNLALDNPWGPGFRAIPGEDARNIPQVLIDKIETKTPSFNFSFNRITGGIDGGIPIIFPFWPRPPLEAHEAVRSAVTPAAVSGRGSYTGAFATISTQTGQTKAKTDTAAEGRKEPPISKEKLSGDRRSQLEGEKQALMQEHNRLKIDAGGQTSRLGEKQKRYFEIEHRLDDIRRELQYDDYLAAIPYETGFIQDSSISGLKSVYHDMNITSEQAQKLKDDQEEREKFILEWFALQAAQRMVLEGLGPEDRKIIYDRSTEGISKDDISILSALEPFWQLYGKVQGDGRSLTNLNSDETRFVDGMRSQIGMDRLTDKEFIAKIDYFKDKRAVIEKKKQSVELEIIGKADHQVKVRAWMSKIKAEIQEIAEKAISSADETASIMEDVGKKGEGTASGEQIAPLSESDKRKISEEVLSEIARLEKKSDPNHIKQAAADLMIAPHDLMQRMIEIARLSKDVKKKKERELAEDIVLMRRIDSTMTREEKAEEMIQTDREIVLDVDAVGLSDKHGNAAVARFNSARQEDIERIVFKEYKRKLPEVYLQEEYIQMLNACFLEINRRKTDNPYSPDDIQQIIQYIMDIHMKKQKIIYRKRRERKDRLKASYRQSIEASAG